MLKRTWGKARRQAPTVARVYADGIPGAWNFKHTRFARWYGVSSSSSHEAREGMKGSPAQNKSRAEYVYGIRPVEAALSVALGLSDRTNQIETMAKYVKLASSNRFKAKGGEVLTWGRRKELNRLYLIENKQKGNQLDNLKAMAARLRIPVSSDRDREGLNRLVGPNNNHQGVALQCSHLPRPQVVRYLDKWDTKVCLFFQV